MRRPRAVVMTAVAAVVAALAGCGIPADERPRQIQPPPGPYGNLASQRPSTAEPGVVEEVLYFTREGMLVAVTRRIRSAPAPADLVRALLAGPTGEERARAIGSALSGVDIGSNIRVVDGQATVDLTATPEGTGRSDAILAYAQVVCTLDALTGITSVAFTLHGVPIGVPRADGSLSEAPLTAADYARLIAPG